MLLRPLLIFCPPGADAELLSVFLDGWTGGVTEGSPNKKLAATVVFLVSRLTKKCAMTVD